MPTRKVSVTPWTAQSAFYIWLPARLFADANRQRRSVLRLFRQDFPALADPCPVDQRSCPSGRASRIPLYRSTRCSQRFAPLCSISNRLPSGENDDCSYCCGAGGGVPPNQPAAYAMTSNTTITTATPYQRRLSLKSIVASRWPVTPSLGDLGRHLPESDLFALQ